MGRAHFTTEAGKQIMDAVSYHRGRVQVSSVGGRRVPVDNGEPDPLPFYTFDASDETTLQVKVTGGLILRGVQYSDVVVADSAALDIEDGDKVWLEKPDSGDLNAWVFSFGADYPTDKLYYALATIAITGTAPNEKVVITRDWEGGDLVMDNIIRVALTQTGGSAGGDGTLCDFTYTVKDEAGDITLMTAATPTLSLARVAAFAATTAATKGIVNILADGGFEFWSCDEVQTVSYTKKDPTLIPDCI